LTDYNLKREQNGLLEAMKRFDFKEGIKIVLEEIKVELKKGIRAVLLTDWLVDELDF